MCEYIVGMYYIIYNFRSLQLCNVSYSIASTVKISTHRCHTSFTIFRQSSTHIGLKFEFNNSNPITKQPPAITLVALTRAFFSSFSTHYYLSPQCLSLGRKSPWVFAHKSRLDKAAARRVWQT